MKTTESILKSTEQGHIHAAVRFRLFMDSDLFIYLVRLEACIRSTLPNPALVSSFFARKIHGSILYWAGRDMFEGTLEVRPVPNWEKSSLSFDPADTSKEIVMLKGTGYSPSLIQQTDNPFPQKVFSFLNQQIPFKFVFKDNVYVRIRKSS